MNNNQIVRPKIFKPILLCIVSIVFFIGGIMMIKENNIEGWFVALFFGIGIIVFIIQLIPGSTQLTLTNEGFIMTSLFRSNFTKWSDVKIFEIGYIGRNNVVVFDYIDTHTKFGIGKSIAKSFSNNHGALPSNYGMKVNELLDLMNDWKNKYT